MSQYKILQSYVVCVVFVSSSSHADELTFLAVAIQTPGRDTGLSGRQEQHYLPIQQFNSTIHHLPHMINRHTSLPDRPHQQLHLCCTL